MPGSEHRETLEAFRALYRAFLAENWHPREQPPSAALEWLSATPLLLRQCQRLVEELEALEALHHAD